MTGDPIDAATAADRGLINKAVPPDQLEASTLDLISRATRGSALSKASGKQGFYHQIELPQDQAYAFAVERMATAWLTPDAQEAFMRFWKSATPTTRSGQRPIPPYKNHGWLAAQTDSHGAGHGLHAVGHLVDQAGFLAQRLLQVLPRQMAGAMQSQKKPAAWRQIWR